MVVLVSRADRWPALVTSIYDGGNPDDDRVHAGGGFPQRVPANSVVRAGGIDRDDVPGLDPIRGAGRARGANGIGAASSKEGNSGGGQEDPGELHTSSKDGGGVLRRATGDRCRRCT